MVWGTPLSYPREVRPRE